MASNAYVSQPLLGPLSPLFFPSLKPNPAFSHSQHSRGLFNFAQATLPSLLEAVPTSPHPPSLIITGATASVRGSARFGTFAAGKFAVRALGQSLAREFGPQGVHVAHVIVDGVIDIPRTKGRNVNDGKEDGKISPDAVSFRALSSLMVEWFSLMCWADRRELLAFAYAASVELHTGAGSQAVCGEVLMDQKGQGRFKLRVC